MKKNIAGLVLAIVLTAMLLAPLPSLYAPSSLMSLSDPVTSAWGSVYTARYQLRGGSCPRAQGQGNRGRRLRVALEH